MADLLLGNKLCQQHGKVGRYTSEFHDLDKSGVNYQEPLLKLSQDNMDLINGHLIHAYDYTEHEVGAKIKERFVCD